MPGAASLAFSLFKDYTACFMRVCVDFIFFESSRLDLSRYDKSCVSIPMTPFKRGVLCPLG